MAFNLYGTENTKARAYEIHHRSLTQLQQIHFGSRIKLAQPALILKNSCGGLIHISDS